MVDAACRSAASSGGGVDGGLTRRKKSVRGRRGGERADSGCPPNQVAREYFLRGTAPANDCSEHAGGVAGFLRRTLEGIGRLFH